VRPVRSPAVAISDMLEQGEKHVFDQPRISQSPVLVSLGSSEPGGGECCHEDDKPEDDDDPMVRHGTGASPRRHSRTTHEKGFGHESSGLETGCQ
jgi:hypothetical protein